MSAARDGSGELSTSAEEPVSGFRALLCERWGFGLLLLLTFGAAVAYRGGLDFDVFLDEYWYWRQTEWFVDRWPPSLEELRSYPEPMTPLSFLIWAIFERATGLGVVGARLATMGMGAMLLGLIGLQRAVRPSVGLRACIGLVVFPYTLALCIHVYTDVPAALFVVGGFWLYARRRPWLAAVCFALAISTRQYMVVFPAALAAAELAPVVFPAALLRFFGAERSGELRASDPRLLRAIPILLSAASMLGWIAFYGGLGPQPGLEDWPRHNVSIAGLEPAYAIYFLTCMGAYFALPEVVLFRTGPRLLEQLRSRRALVLAVVLGAAFAAFFPFAEDVSMGPINRAARTLLPLEMFGFASTAARFVLYVGLATIACVRFARLGLPFWLLLTSGCLMLASFEAWEKYNLAILATLWYLRSLSALDRPFELWGAVSHASSARPA